MSVQNNLDAWFQTNPEVTTKSAPEAFGVMPSTAKVYLSTLAKKGVLRRTSPGVYVPGDNWKRGSVSIVRETPVLKPSSGRPPSPESLLSRERERLLLLKAEAESKASSYGLQIRRIDIALNALGTEG